MNLRKPALVLALAAWSAAPAGAQGLTGAGATFPYPIYTKWFDAYNKATGVQINYQSIGSGGGIRQFTEGTVDFGATDGPMNPAQMDAVQGDVIHLPTVIGAVVLTYNLPVLGATQLKFDGPTIADIFLGKITKWNDNRIAALNPGVGAPEHRHHRGPPLRRVGHQLHLHRLPDQGVPRVEGQGGLRHLRVVADRPRRQGQRGRHPAGQAARGRHRLRRTDLRPVATSCPTPRSRTRPGSSSCPSLASVTAAAASAKFTKDTDFRVSITDAPGAESYPISSFTWLLVRTEQQGPGQGQGPPGVPDLDDHAGGPGDGRPAAVRAAAGCRDRAHQAAHRGAQGRRQADPGQLISPAP